MELLKIHDDLRNAGWYEGRNICTHFSELPATSLLPREVMKILSEFGGLTLESFGKDGKLIQKIEIPTPEEFYSYYDEKRCLTENYFPGHPVDLKKGSVDNVYYYSVLLGVQIYPLAHSAEGQIYIDEHGNLYELNFLNDFYWVGNDIIHGLERLIHGNGPALLLGGQTKTEWIGPHQDFMPPLNEALNGIDPWGSI